MQKNESSNLKKNYNPLLEDLLEAREREAEKEAAAQKLRREVDLKLESVEREMFLSIAAKERLRNRQDEVGQRKVSIMQSSLSREQIETIDNKMKSDFIGPGYYNPKLMFGKKVAQSITIPREDRRLKPIPQLRTSTIDSHDSSVSRGRGGGKNYHLNSDSQSQLPEIHYTVSPMSHHYARDSNSKSNFRNRRLRRKNANMDSQHSSIGNEQSIAEYKDDSDATIKKHNFKSQNLGEIEAQNNGNIAFEFGQDVRRSLPQDSASCKAL